MCDKEWKIFFLHVVTVIFNIPSQQNGALTGLDDIHLNIRWQIHSSIGFLGLFCSISISLWHFKTIRRHFLTTQVHWMLDYHETYSRWSQKINTAVASREFLSVGGEAGVGESRVGSSRVGSSVGINQLDQTNEMAFPGWRFTHL